MPDTNLKSILESLLFVSSKPIKSKSLAVFLDKSPEEIQTAFLELAEERKNTGLVVLQNREEFQMATNPKNSEAVKNFLNLDLREKLTEATVEVLSIVAYRQPISKAEIEAIRGVNSQYSLRHLLMRGLIEKIQNPADQRSQLYQTTTEFLQHMGIASVSELPEFPELNLKVRLPETPALKNQSLEKTDPENTPDTNPPSAEVPQEQHETTISKTAENTPEDTVEEYEEDEEDDEDEEE